MVLRTLLGDGPPDVIARIGAPLDPRRVIVVGARDLDPAEREYVASAGVGLVEGWPGDVSARVSDHLRAAGVRQLYVHVDVDVFDSESYGDALFSVAGGPTLESASLAMRPIAEAFDVVGVGVVESCGRDPGAASALKEFLVGSGLWQKTESWR
jgi:arginase